MLAAKAMKRCATAAGTIHWSASAQASRAISEPSPVRTCASRSDGKQGDENERHSDQGERGREAGRRGRELPGSSRSRQGRENGDTNGLRGSHDDDEDSVRGEETVRLVSPAELACDENPDERRRSR